MISGRQSFKNNSQKKRDFAKVEQALREKNPQKAHEELEQYHVEDTIDRATLSHLQLRILQQAMKHPDRNLLKSLLPKMYLIDETVEKIFALPILLIKFARYGLPLQQDQKLIELANKLDAIDDSLFAKKEEKYGLIMAYLSLAEFKNMDDTESSQNQLLSNALSHLMDKKKFTSDEMISKLKNYVFPVLERIKSHTSNQHIENLIWVYCHFNYFEKVHEMLQKEANTPEKIHLLGLLYLHGHDCAQNNLLAFETFKENIENNYTPSLITLEDACKKTPQKNLEALIFLIEYYADKNLEHAIKWHALLVQHGNPSFILNTIRNNQVYTQNKSLLSLALEYAYNATQTGNALVKSAAEKLLLAHNEHHHARIYLAKIYCDRKIYKKAAGIGFSDELSFYMQKASHLQIILGTLFTNPNIRQHLNANIYFCFLTSPCISVAKQIKFINILLNEIELLHLDENDYLKIIRRLAEIKIECLNQVSDETFLQNNSHFELLAEKGNFKAQFFLFIYLLLFSHDDYVKQIKDNIQFSHPIIKELIRFDIEIKLYNELEKDWESYDELLLPKRIYGFILKASVKNLNQHSFFTDKQLASIKEKFTANQSTSHFYLFDMLDELIEKRHTSLYFPALCFALLKCIEDFRNTHIFNPALNNQTIKAHSRSQPTVSFRK